MSSHSPATRPFHEREPLPSSLTIPPWLAAALGVTLLAGGVVGALGDGTLPHRLATAVYTGSALAYLGVTLVDFYEHFRLEHEATGHWFGSTVVPVGESVNHLLTIGVVVSILGLGRPLQAPLELRDVWVLLAPAVFLLLGWRDELVYHRRRCAHREDLMHTTAHLAAGVMLASFAAVRLVDWSGM